MPRLNVVDPASATGKAKELFDGPLKGMHINIFKGMANSPAGLNAYLQITGALKQGVLSDAERETIQLAVSQVNGCDYCLAAHTMLGKNAGLTEEQTVAIRRNDATGDAKLDALTRFTVAVQEKKGFVSNDELSAFRGAGYDDAAVVEVAATIAAITFTNLFNHIHETDVDFPAAPAV